MPLHPAIVHFPIALSFILPILIVLFAYFIKTNKMAASSWLIIIGLQMAVTGFGYLALETGETDEKLVEKVVSKKLIHAHEEKAEIFVGTSVLALILSIIVFFLRKDLQFQLKLGVAIISIVAAFLAYQTGTLGGELVYRYGAAGGHIGATTSFESILPTPGKSTSESDSNINESLKADENEYGDEDSFQSETKLDE